MSSDDIEHFESRLGDRVLFQNISLFFLSASTPLLIEKWIDYDASNAQTDLALVIVCTIGVAIGILFGALAVGRQRRLKRFRNQLFQRERKLDTTFTMVDTSASATEYQTRGAV